MQHDPKKVIVIDTETTGFNPYDDELVQISIIDGNGTELFNRYTCPQKSKEWPDAEKVNGISFERVKNCPAPAYYAHQITDIVQDAEIIISYNGLQFDIPFLEAIGVIFPNQEKVKFLDVMFDYAEYCGDWNEYKQEYRWKKLIDAAASFGYTYKAHDSLNDCQATLFVAKKLYTKNSKWFCL